MVSRREVCFSLAVISDRRVPPDFESIRRIESPQSIENEENSHHLSTMTYKRHSTAKDLKAGKPPDEVSAKPIMPAAVPIISWGPSSREPVPKFGQGSNRALEV
jgi:hypothetical protein